MSNLRLQRQILESLTWFHPSEVCQVVVHWIPVAYLIMQHSTFPFLFSPFTWCKFYILNVKEWVWHKLLTQVIYARQDAENENSVAVLHCFIDLSNVLFKIFCDKKHLQVYGIKFERDRKSVV